MWRRLLVLGSLAVTSCASAIGAPRPEPAAIAVGGATIDVTIDAPVAPDLNALWRELGVSGRDGAVELDEHAPKAAIRRAISARPAAPAKR